MTNLTRYTAADLPNLMDKITRNSIGLDEYFDRLFNLKWTPPGRGLWIMGTELVNVQRNSAALQNCAFVSTGEMSKDNPAEPFAFLHG